MTKFLPEHLRVFMKAGWGVYQEAANELVVVSVITAAPFIIGLMAFVLIRPAPFTPHATPSAYFEAVFLRGQLFLISVSYLATSLYRLFNSDRSYRRPDVINIFSLFVFGVIGIFYGINPAFAQFENPTVTTASLAAFILSVLFYFYTAVLAYERPPSVANTLDLSAAHLSDRLAALRQSGDAQ